MTCRVYFRGKKSGFYALIEKCPGEYEAICFAIKTWGSSVNFVQEYRKKAPEGEYKLLKTITYETI